MANEYILKDKALNLIEHNDRVCHYADERYENVVYATAQTICKVVADMEAADVQPVLHGRWENTSTPNQLRCSECDVIHFIAQYPHGEINFCPNCGAKMIKDGDEE